MINITNQLLDRYYMNLIRFLIIAAIVWLILRMFRNWQSKNIIAKKKATKDALIKNMVQCSTCGVHLPEQEALKINNKFYCSEEHKI